MLSYAISTQIVTKIFRAWSRECDYHKIQQYSDPKYWNYDYIMNCIFRAHFKSLGGLAILSYRPFSVVINHISYAWLWDHWWGFNNEIRIRSILLIKSYFKIVHPSLKKFLFADKPLGESHFCWTKGPKQHLQPRSTIAFDPYDAVSVSKWLILAIAELF